ncbi:hypothetical protein [Vibrio gazogenes]|uniref:VCBS repeat-containing protein n=1 Tax=Vibrio gazogenes TaxID=687 RepID=A0A1Z2SIK8_VIBGA|nr:hypothetical protein [Vibrio gazogenes]ASA56965.1 hypothetical protein BSQ33_15510 [Vibrio gazogenes]
MKVLKIEKFLIINSLFLFSILMSMNVLAYDLDDFKNDDQSNIYDIDVNHDGVKDAVVNDSSHEEILVFLNINGGYQYQYKSENYNFQGVYMVRDIKEENSDDIDLSIISMFSGAGGQEKKYFLSIEDNKLELVQTVTFDSFYDDDLYSLHICVISKLGRETCHVTRSDKNFNTKFIDEYPYEKSP